MGGASWPPPVRSIRGLEEVALTRGSATAGEPSALTSSTLPRRGNHGDGARPGKRPSDPLAGRVGGRGGETFVAVRAEGGGAGAGGREDVADLGARRVQRRVVPWLKVTRRVRVPRGTVELCPLFCTPVPRGCRRQERSRGS